MKTFLVTDGDLDLTGGQLTLVTESPTYVRQKATARLRMLQGEWLLDTRLGFPWFQEVLGKRVSPERLDSLVRQALLTILDVVSVDSLSIIFNNEARSYQISYTVRTATGQLVSGGVPFVLS